MKRATCFLMLTSIALAVGFLPDRRRLASTQPPFTALARISAHGGVGCGVLVGPDLLLTCSHCVGDENRNLYTDVDVELGLGFHQITHHAKVNESFKKLGSNVNVNSGDDWAIVRLDRPLGYFYGWMESLVVSDKEWPLLTPELLGYCECPDDLRPEFGHMDKPYLCSGRVSHVGPNILFHDLSMWGGSSGAPVILSDAQGRYNVVALNFAGVEIEGEKREHGFRSRYAKEHANLAIPARRWQEQLASLKPAKAATIRTLWIRNHSSQPIRVVARYQSVFQDPGSPAMETQEIEIPWQRRVAVIKPEEGCVDPDIYLSVSDARGNPVGPKATLETESNGTIRKFFKKHLGAAAEYTTSLP